MPLFGKKKEGEDKVFDEIRKAVDGVNVPQQSDVSQQPQIPETKADILEEMQKQFEQRQFEQKQREQKQFEHRPEKNQFEQKQHEQKQFEHRQPEKNHFEESQREEKREEVKQEVKESERPAFAPLFVKIDRYRQILNSIGYLKTTMIMIKNSLMALTELDKAREETIKLIQDAVGKLENRLVSLDKELVRPTGYHEISEKHEYHDVETVEATVADLKGQIEQLRSELQTMS